MAQQDGNSEQELILPASDEVKMEIVKELESGNFDEARLERALVIVPELLDPTPFFCGRQLPTESGPIDLFGLGGIEYPSQSVRIRQAIFPTVYELKAREIRRSALIQVFDYSKRIEEMSAEDLVWHLVVNSGNPRAGIPRIWEPKEILDIIEAVWERGKVILKVIVGTSYNPQMASLADELDIKLYTVRELCAGYRERVDHT